MKPRSFNPLDYASLAKSLERELMACELVPLANVDKFYGDGVYALFYTGSFAPYAQMSRVNQKSPGVLPIYIGKASPQTLKGASFDSANIDTPAAGHRLYTRINRDHRASIQSAENLDVADFSCKILVLNAVWVALAESALIGAYAPVWNGTIDGFGNHDPGKGRAAGRISRWDVLHPGRGRETSAEVPFSAEGLAQEVRADIAMRVDILGIA